MGEEDSATSVTVTAEFSNTNTYGEDQTVTVSVGSTGTATSGTDYAAVTDFDLTVTRGETSGTATFTLTPTQDPAVEGDETIGVAGSATGLTVNGAEHDADRRRHGASCGGLADEADGGRREDRHLHRPAGNRPGRHGDGDPAERRLRGGHGVPGRR